MDIIFAGSPASSAEILSELVNSPFNVSLVLTQGDKRSSRNKREEPSEVAKYAEIENLPCLKIDSFCDDALPVTCVKAAPDNAAKVELSAESSIVTSSVGEDPPPAAESRIKRMSPS